MKKSAKFGTTFAESETEIDPDLAAEILATEPQFEEIVALRYNYALQEYTLTEILSAEQSGEMDSDMVDEYAAQAIEDHTLGQEEILGIEMVETVEMSRNHSGGVADFSATFSQTLATLIENEFEDVDSAVVEISNASGLTPDAVVGMVSGQLAPDLSQGMEVLEGIASVFDNLAEDAAAYNEFIDLGSNAYDQVISQVPQTASMSSADHALRAEFAALQQKEVIGQNFRNLERQCDRGQDAGWLTPDEARILLGEFEERSDRTAAFSQACEETGNDPMEQLSKIEHYLYVAEQRGPLLKFNNGVETMADFNAEPVDEKAAAYAQQYRDRNGYK